MILGASFPRLSEAANGESVTRCSSNPLQDSEEFVTLGKVARLYRIENLSA